jgi:hypothetical protein
VHTFFSRQLSTQSNQNQEISRAFHTPSHGPGIAVKALLQGSFSLMVFGWAQIVMDLQPLFVLITGDGHLHGFSHTYGGAILLAIFSVLSGKYLSEIGLYFMGLNRDWKVMIGWPLAFLSAIALWYSLESLNLRRIIMQKLRDTYRSIKGHIGAETEPFESVELVEAYRRYFKPEKVRVVLLADSSTTSDTAKKA